MYLLIFYQRYIWMIIFQITDLQWKKNSHFAPPCFTNKLTIRFEKSATNWYFESENSFHSICSLSVIKYTNSIQESIYTPPGFLPLLSSSTRSVGRTYQKHGGTLASSEEGRERVGRKSGASPYTFFLPGRGVALPYVAVRKQALWRNSPNS